MTAAKTDPSAIILPFGKHKGATVAELLAKDPAYADWIMAQGWVAQRFAELHAAIASRGAGTDDTPEHNALQARFLDPEFRAACLRVAIPEALDKHRDDAEKFRNSKWFDAERQRAEYGTLTTEVLFERAGVDVTICWSFMAYINKVGISASGSTEDNRYRATLVELKPSIGDDYPGVLRQMANLRCTVCVAEKYVGRGVLEAQLVAMFQASGRILVFIRDIEAMQSRGLLL